MIAQHLSGYVIWEKDVANLKSYRQVPTCYKALFELNLLY